MSEDIGKLGVFELKGGAHTSPQTGVCAMEAVAWLAGEEHGDKPDCACPLIGDMVRTINDVISDKQRQRLIPFLPRIIGSKPVKDHPQKGMRVAKEPRLLRLCEFVSMHNPSYKVDEVLIEYEIADQIFDPEGVLYRGHVLWSYIAKNSWHLCPLAMSPALDYAERMVSQQCWESAVSMAGHAGHAALMFGATRQQIEGDSLIVIKIPDESVDRALELLEVALNAGPQGQCDYDYGPAVERYRSEVLEVA